MSPILRLALGAAATIALLAPTVQAGGPHYHADRHARYKSDLRPWHSEYKHTAYGYPVPLVVPPTSRTVTEWSWGVAQSEVRPIYHQFRRPYLGEIDGELEPLHSTPGWPSHTRQFGVNAVRGPWK